MECNRHKSPDREAGGTISRRELLVNTALGCAAGGVVLHSFASVWAGCAFGASTSEPKPTTSDVGARTMGQKKTTARLLDYRYVHPGFETVIGSDDVEMGKVWNLWFNVTLSDEPGKWDGQIRALNDIEKALGGMTTEQRLIRAHMAEFCRFSPSFPGSIDVLCSEIGQGALSTPIGIGCEGRGLLNSLGYHDAGSMDKQRIDMLTWYGESLTRWLAAGEPQTPLDHKVSGFLGEATETKRKHVEELSLVVGGASESIVSLRKRCADTCKVSRRARPFNCLNCLGEGERRPACQCSWAMLIDACLLCADGHEGADSRARQFKRFHEENILAFAVALNAWLEQRQPKVPDSLTKGQFVSQQYVADVARRVSSSLGQKDRVKEWLAGCLLKTITANQRWRRGEELIDRFPEATSWLKRIASG